MRQRSMQPGSDEARSLRVVAEKGRRKELGSARRVVDREDEPHRTCSSQQRRKETEPLLRVAVAEDIVPHCSSTAEGVAGGGGSRGGRPSEHPGPEQGFRPGVN